MNNMPVECTENMGFPTLRDPDAGVTVFSSWAAYSPWSWCWCYCISQLGFLRSMILMLVLLYFPAGLPTLHDPDAGVTVFPSWAVYSPWSWCWCYCISQLGFLRSMILMLVLLYFPAGLPTLRDPDAGVTVFPSWAVYSPWSWCWCYCIFQLGCLLSVIMMLVLLYFPAGLPTLHDPDAGVTVFSSWAVYSPWSWCWCYCIFQLGCLLSMILMLVLLYFPAGLPTLRDPDAGVTVFSSWAVYSPWSWCWCYCIFQLGCLLSMILMLVLLYFPAGLSTLRDPDASVTIFSSWAAYSPWSWCWCYCIFQLGCLLSMILMLLLLYFPAGLPTLRDPDAGVTVFSSWAAYCPWSWCWCYCIFQLGCLLSLILMLVLLYFPAGLPTLHDPDAGVTVFSSWAAYCPWSWCWCYCIFQLGCLLSMILMLVLQHDHIALYFGTFFFGLFLSSVTPTALSLAEQYIDVTCKSWTYHL